jgi:hypothetical protein
MKRTFTEADLKNIQEATQHDLLAFLDGMPQDVQTKVCQIVVDNVGKYLNKKPIEVGSVVRYKEGWCKVTRKTRNTVNLGGIFNGKIYHKGVPLDEVYEDHDAWYANWQESETYKCM